jgi:methanogenic corrinoid protein MtbC1
LDLALLALNELAKRKSSKKVTYDHVDIEKFCESIISKNDDLQVQLIETLIERGISLDIIYETFIPEVAESLGNLWKINKVTFIEVNIGAQRLHRLSRIYEKQYLGPMYIFSEGPDILLILPGREVHTLGLITASGIFKKNGANPFIAVGYSDKEIISLIKSQSFELIGMSVSNSDNISDCLETAKKIKKSVTKSIPMVVGGQGVNQSKNPELSAVFDKITTNPREALELIAEQKYN